MSTNDTRDDEDVKDLDAMIADEIEVVEPVAPKVRKPRVAVVAEEAPRLHSVLTNEEVFAAQLKAKEKLAKERRVNAMKAVEEAEIQRLRNEEGMVTGDGARDELIEITLDLASHSDRIVLNGVAYFHARTYKVPRHVADTMREIQARGWGHEDEKDGKDRLQHYQANRMTKMSAVTGATKNAPTAPDAAVV